MKRTISIIMILSASALLLASCGKEPMPGKGRAKAIKLTVNGVDTKAPVVTTSTLDSLGVFNITAFATDKWRVDSVGQSIPVYDPGLYVDPVGGTLQDINVSKSTGWTIAGNEDTSSPAFSWINAVAMNFFAYAPVSINGTRNLSWNSVASPYTALPFTYTASSTSGTVASSACDDLIFAFASNKVTYESDHTSADFGEIKDGSDTFNLTFYHALAQIRFCVSTDDDTFGKSTKLVSVKVKNEPLGGTGEFNGGGSISAGTLFTWTPSSTKADFLQTFTNAIFPGPPASGSEVIPTGWEKSTYSKDSNTYNLYTCTGDVLFLVPQANFTGKKVDVTIQEGTDDPVTIEASLPDGSWEAGKYYTYKIKALKKLSLTLFSKDWIDGSKDLEF